jgi:hypothetical protein
MQNRLFFVRKKYIHFFVSGAAAVGVAEEDEEEAGGVGFRISCEPATVIIAFL